MLRDNTNLYTSHQNPPIPKWKPTWIPELKNFVAITIYMGIYHFPTIHDYWKIDDIAPVTSMIINRMTRDRYVLLRRMIHCSDPNHENEVTIGTNRHKKPVWYKKMQPFANEIRKNWKKLRTPNSHYTIDECMIKETGRTHYSTIAPGKPINERYKLFAINNEDYLYNYSWYSSVKNHEGKPKVKKLGETSAMVYKLATDILPPNSILFMDNYFSESKIAKKLMAVKIAICETMKPNRTNIPELLVKMKQAYAKNISYGILAAMIQNDVLMIAWQDNNLVLTLTTAYDVKNVDDNVSKKRKRPSRTNTNARVVLSAFKENNENVWEKKFKIPKIFHYYNKHMGKINRFNALITTYSSQRACNRTWMSQFHWKLNESFTNAFKLCEPIEMFRQEYQTFLEQIIMRLFEEGKPTSQSRQGPTSISTLPKPVRGNHEWQDLKTIRQCFMCRLDRQKNDVKWFDNEISGNNEKVQKIRGGCEVCKVSLCKKGICIERFHHKKVWTESIQ